jgi:hypothetical protein
MTARLSRSPQDSRWTTNIHKACPASATSAARRFLSEPAGSPASGVEVAQRLQRGLERAAEPPEGGRLFLNDLGLDQVEGAGG